MTLIQQIISKQLLSVRYHNRTVTLLVPRPLLPKFREEFENNPNFDGHCTIRFKEGYLRLGALALTAEGQEHTNTVVLVNPEDGCPKAVEESKMIPDKIKGIKPTWEIVRFYNE